MFLAWLLSESVQHWVKAEKNRKNLYTANILYAVISGFLGYSIGCGYSSPISWLNESSELDVVETSDPCRT